MDGAGSEDVDLMSLMGPEVSADPRPMYQALRDATPVLRLDGGMVIVSTRATVEEVFRSPDVFSSNMSAADLGNIRPLIPLQIDPPDHVLYRRLLDPLFAPRQMAKLEPEIAALAHRLIDRFVDEPGCDLVSTFTIPLPSEVFLTMFGLPLEELDTFLTMKDGIIRPAGETMAEQDVVRKATAASIYEYFGEILEKRRVDPRDDLLTGFLTAEVDGRQLTGDEIADICFLLMIAGLDTVTATLDCFFSYLARTPGHRRRVVDDPDTIPAVVEELLRFETPVAGVPRIAVKDIELGGVQVSDGDQVMVVLGAANTDDAEFAHAQAVDFGRETNRHLAFGGGVHRCLGSHLARLELRVALREFHSRIPSYHLAPGAELEYSPGIRSLTSLPLVFGD